MNTAEIQNRARMAVAGRSTDAADCTRLLDMLGIPLEGVAVLPSGHPGHRGDGRRKFVKGGAER